MTPYTPAARAIKRALIFAALFLRSLTAHAELGNISAYVVGIDPGGYIQMGKNSFVILDRGE